jgi:hypothetical protein
VPPVPHDRPLALGESLPDLGLQAPDGSNWSLSALRGRTLVLVCVRYYG